MLTLMKLSRYKRWCRKCIVNCKMLYYFEKMAEAAERKEGKDTEHKNMVLTILKYGGEALAIGLMITAWIFIGKADIKFPLKMKA